MNWQPIYVLLPLQAMAGLKALYIKLMSEACAALLNHWCPYKGTNQARHRRRVCWRRLLS